MRIYISSTFEDLQEHRAAAIQTLHQLGHEVIAMEYYGPGSVAPLEKVLDDVARCDLYVGIFAWHYGYIPRKVKSTPKVPGANPGVTSITEFEYRQAAASGLDILAFLSAPHAQWPAHLIDGITRPKDAHRLSRLRAELEEQRMIAYFSTPESLASKVSTAVSTLRLRVEVEQRLLAPLRSESAVPELASKALFDSHVVQVKKFVAQSIRLAAATVNLKSTWWSSRLYLLAAIGQTAGQLQRVIFVQGRELIGIASTNMIRRIMPKVHNEQSEKLLLQFEQRLTTEPLDNIDEALDHLINAWGQIIGESDQNISYYNVTAASLEHWFGEALLKESVRIADISALTALDLLRILDYPNDLVPVTEYKRKRRAIVQLVDKRRLTDRVARNTVQEMLERLGLF